MYTLSLSVYYCIYSSTERVYHTVIYDILCNIESKHHTHHHTRVRSMLWPFLLTYIDWKTIYIWKHLFYKLQNTRIFTPRPESIHMKFNCKLAILLLFILIPCYFSKVLNTFKTIKRIKYDSLSYFVCFGFWLWYCFI